MITTNNKISYFGFDFIRKSTINVVSVLSMFNIVQFKNDPCPISDSEEGICYREDECTQKGGVARSKCASGFGICCLCKLSNILFICFKSFVMNYPPECIHKFR